MTDSNNIPQHMAIDLNQQPNSAQPALIKLINKLTGVKPYEVEGEIILKPQMCGRLFFERLNEALLDTNYTYMVSRDLQVTIFKI